MEKYIITFVCVFMVNIFLTNAQEEKNTFSYKVGDYEVILLSEGQQSNKPTILIGASQEMIDETMPDGTYPSAVNAFLVKTPEKNILFDTGFGRNLFDNMKQFGVSAEDIHTLVITHMHGDHIGGMLKDGKKTFPNAIVILSEIEKEYWSNEEEMNKLPENRRGSFRSAQNVLDAYDDKLLIIQPHKVEKRFIGDGVFFLEAYGHTPGHIACLVQSGNEQLLIWADLTHVMALQMPYPEIAVTYDVNPELAVKSRKKILKYVTIHKIPVAGMHIAYPGIGTVEKASKGYRFIPAQ